MLQVEGEIAEKAAKYKERAAERAARPRLRKAGQMREPTSDEVDEELPKAPEMSELVIGKRQWWAALCDCTFYHKGGECDCPDCTYITHNTTRLRRDMLKWHTGPNKKCHLGCMDVGGGFREALVDVHELTKYLLCDRIDVEEITRKGAKRPFWTYKSPCLHSKCSAPVLGRKCGWSGKVPRCPMLESS